MVVSPTDTLQPPTCHYTAIAITTFSNIAAIAAFCRISPSILNRFQPNLQA